MTFGELPDSVFEEIAPVLEAEADRLERRETGDPSDGNESRAAVP